MRTLSSCRQYFTTVYNPDALVDERFMALQMAGGTYYFDTTSGVQGKTSRVFAAVNQDGASFALTMSKCLGHGSSLDTEKERDRSARLRLRKYVDPARPLLASVLKQPLFPDDIDRIGRACRALGREPFAACLNVGSQHRCLEQGEDVVVDVKVRAPDAASKWITIGPLYGETLAASAPKIWRACGEIFAPTPQAFPHLPRGCGGLPTARVVFAWGLLLDLLEACAEVTGADATVEGHGPHWVHHDIAPGNLVFDRARCAAGGAAFRLVDLASVGAAEHGRQAQVAPNDRTGTSGFMAPEMVAARQAPGPDTGRDPIDQSACAWSVGTVFLAMLAAAEQDGGDTPFIAPTGRTEAEAIALEVAHYAAAQAMFPEFAQNTPAAELAVALGADDHDGPEGGQFRAFWRRSLDWGGADLCRVVLGLVQPAPGQRTSVADAIGQLRGHADIAGREPCAPLAGTAGDLTGAFRLCVHHALRDDQMTSANVARAHTAASFLRRRFAGLGASHAGANLYQIAAAGDACRPLRAHVEAAGAADAAGSTDGRWAGRA